MSHRGGGTRFPAKPLAGRLVSRELRIENLDRDIPAQAGIPGLQHSTHPPAAEQPTHFKVGNPTDEIRIQGGL